MRSVSRSVLFAVLGVTFGLGFYEFDNRVKDRAPSGSTVRLLCNGFELLVLCPSMGLLAWLASEKLRQKEERHQRGLEQERERRFQFLGRVAASVAHEIRNPLQNLWLVGEALRDEVPADNRTLVDRLDANLNRLDHAVSLVYELSRPNRGADGVEFDPVALMPLIHEAVIEAKGRCAKPVQVEVIEPRGSVIVAGREASLRIALGNLVRNAIEATGEGLTRISCRRDGGRWVIDICNPGELPEDIVAGEIPLVSGKPGGMGVGLTITRNLVDHLGGQLTFANRDGMVIATLSLAATNQETDHA